MRLRHRKVKGKQHGDATTIVDARGLNVRGKRAKYSQAPRTSGVLRVDGALRIHQSFVKCVLRFQGSEKLT